MGPTADLDTTERTVLSIFKTEPLLTSCMGIQDSSVSLVTRVRAGKLKDRGSISSRV